MRDRAVGLHPSIRPRITPTVDSLTRLLLPELLEFHTLPLDLRVLFGQLPLHVLLLFLPCLHLIADQGAADQSDCGADAGARAGIPGGRADDCAQAGAGESSDPCAFFSRR